MKHFKFKTYIIFRDGPDGGDIFIGFPMHQDGDDARKGIGFMWLLSNPKIRELWMNDWMMELNKFVVLGRFN